MARYSRWNPIDEPPEETIEKYLRCHRSKWAKSSYTCFKERIYKYHRYLEQKRGRALGDTSKDDLRAYERYLRWSQVSEGSIVQYLQTIGMFCRWLSSKNLLTSTLYELGLERPKFDPLESHLAELTDAYAIKVHRIYATEFYVYLEEQEINVSSLDRLDIEAYERQLREQKPSRPLPARRLHMRCVNSHIKWLCERGVIDKKPSYFGINRLKFHKEINIVLPEIAKKYLHLAKGYRAHRTVKGYSTSLKHLYRYLGAKQISLTDFSRSDFEDFISQSIERGYSAVAVNHHIGGIQIYLTWLFQCGHLSQNPEPLICDFPRPRQTDSLPRYLPVEVDKILQHKLSSSSNINAWGLYLMRRIGIRMSDLRELSFDCLSRDERGLNYIKIPPGKLRKERLFPLDAETLKLVKKIQKKSIENAGRNTPEKLVIHTSGKPPQDNEYYKILYEISEHIRLDCGISVGPESLVSHRLRHTFATTMINTGISIEVLKELLGHRDVKMTLKYARVMPETIRKDYLAALDKIENDIKLPEIKNSQEYLGGNDALGDLLMKLRAKNAAESCSNIKIKSLIRRIERLRSDLKDLP